MLPYGNIWLINGSNGSDFTVREHIREYFRVGVKKVMSDYLNECAKCDNQGGIFSNSEIKLYLDSLSNLWRVKCTECGHEGPKGWFQWSARKKWNSQRSEASIKSQEEWRRTVQRIFDEDHRSASKDKKTCPSCSGGGISMLGVAIGSMVCMECGGSGEVDE